MGNLVLIVIHERAARRKLRRALEERGYEPVECSSGTAALEILQRLPTSFRLVLVGLDLPGLPGEALIETLRMFRPELPVLCVEMAERAATGIGCRTVSDGAEELEVEVMALEEGRGNGQELSVRPEAVARKARECYTRTGDLVEVAREVAKGLPPG